MGRRGIPAINPIPADSRAQPPPGPSPGGRLLRGLAQPFCQLLVVEAAGVNRLVEGRILAGPVESRIAQGAALGPGRNHGAGDANGPVVGGWGLLDAPGGGLDVPEHAVARGPALPAAEPLSVLEL